MNPEFNVLFDELLKEKVDGLAREPSNLELLVEAVTLYHMIIEGMLALTGQHFIIEYNEDGHPAGLRRGLQQHRARRAPACGLRCPLPARWRSGTTAIATPSADARSRSRRRRGSRPCWAKEQGIEPLGYGIDDAPSR